MSPCLDPMNIKLVGSKLIEMIGDENKAIFYILSMSTTSKTKSYPLLSPISKYPLSNGP
jgi:hypothetical protein